MARKKSRGAGRAPKRAGVGDMKPRKHPSGGAGGGVPGSPSSPGGAPSRPKSSAAGVPGVSGLLAGGVPGIRMPSDTAI
jgi:hypothetical protein